MAIIAAVAVPHPPIILPEIGQGRECEIQKTIDAYREAMRTVAALAPDTVVVLSPHTVMYSDYFHISPGRVAGGDLAQFNAPQVQVSVRYDEKFVSALADSCHKNGVAAGTLGERNPALDHASIIPLRFLAEFIDCQVVRIGLSGLSAAIHYKLGQCIAEVADEQRKRVVIIASGDLSHKLKEDGPYGFVAEGPEFDKQAVAALSTADFLALLELDRVLSTKAGECGLHSFWIMAGCLDGLSVEANCLSYEGPFGVGYTVAVFSVQGCDARRDFGRQLLVREQCRLQKRRQAEDKWVHLARLGLETYILTGQQARLPAVLPTELRDERAGVFVSLKKDGQLRGCIGTVIPMKSCIGEEILHNAISAGVNDPRFDAVRAEELAELVYSVDVLGMPEPISSLQQLAVEHYGVIVENGTRRGLLLPCLDGIDTVEEQVAVAKRKAGINPEEPVRLWRFEVVRHQ